MAHEWTNGETITAEKLNDIENNIEAQQNVSDAILLVTTTIDAGQTYSDVSMTSDEIMEYVNDGERLVNLFVVDESSTVNTVGNLYVDLSYDDTDHSVHFEVEGDIYFRVDNEGHVTYSDGGK